MGVLDMVVLGLKTFSFTLNMNPLEVKRFPLTEKEKFINRRENAWAFSSLSNRLPERTVVYAPRRRRRVEAPQAKRARAITGEEMMAILDQLG